MPPAYPRPRIRLAVAAAAACLLAACESALFSKEVDVAAEGEPPAQLFAELTTADTVWRVWLTNGLRSDEAGPGEALAGATVTLTAGGEAFGPFALAEEAVYVGFPTDQTDPFEVFAPLGAYTLEAPRRLRPGEDVELRVELPGGETAAWSRRMPGATAARFLGLTREERDTTFRDDGFSTAIRPGELAVALPGASGPTRYYRARVAFRLYDETGALRGTDYRSLGVRFENGAEAERVVAPGIVSDERVALDTFRQVFSFFTPFVSRYGRDRDGRELPGIDSMSAALTVEAIDEPSARYYADLHDARRAEGDFFAEPVALGSQVEGLIGHLVLATAAEPFVFDPR